LGENILRDPGFENHLTLSGGGGPGGDDIPFYNADVTSISGYLAADLPVPWCFPALTWSDKTCAPDVVGWGQSFARHWNLSTVGPEAGTYHARLNQASVAGSGPHYLYALGGRSCRNRFRMYSARVQQGDVVTWSSKWRHVGLESGGIPFISTIITWFDSTFAEIPFSSFFSSNQPLASVYTQYSWTELAPFGAYYCLTTTRLSYNFPNSTCQIDADTFSLGVAGDP
jgi:hypothetical protein